MSKNNITDVPMMGTYTKPALGVISATPVATQPNTKKNWLKNLGEDIQDNAAGFLTGILGKVDTSNVKVNTNVGLDQSTMIYLGGLMLAVFLLFKLR